METKQLRVSSGRDYVSALAMEFDILPSRQVSYLYSMANEI